jgi:ATP-binding cassette subfamily B protein
MYIPEYLFFDEATNSLDASNERIIMENLNQFFQSKTVGHPKYLW